MIAIGEQSGSSRESSPSWRESYDEEVDIATQRMTAILEPALIVAIAFVVAFHRDRRDSPHAPARKAGGRLDQKAPPGSRSTAQKLARGPPEVLR